MRSYTINVEFRGLLQAVQGVWLEIQLVLQELNFLVNNPHRHGHQAVQYPSILQTNSDSEAYDWDNH